MSMAVKAWTAWFKEGQFYLYGVVYTMVRMAVNVVMSVQGFYLRVALNFGDPNKPAETPLAIALTPLFAYTLSLFF